MLTGGEGEREKRYTGKKARGRIGAESKDLLLRLSPLAKKTISFPRIVIFVVDIIRCAIGLDLMHL